MQFILNKYIIRLGIAVAIWVFFKIATAPHMREMLSLGKPDVFYFIITVSITFIMFEIADTVKNAMIKRYGMSFGDLKYLTIFFFISLFLSIPALIPMIYLIEFVFEPLLQIQDYSDQWTEFTRNLTFSIFFVLVVLAGYIIQYLHSHQKQMLLIQSELNRENIAFKYTALKNQLNPHFLFNSLSVLTSLVYRNPDTASDFIAQLSKIHRYVLENKENDLVSLAKELDFIQSYLFLMKIRHEDGIDVNYSIDVEEHKCFIPTLSLQLLVENAIKHTAFSTESPLSIEIVSEEGAMLMIRNNISKRNAHKPTGTSTGLDNIKNRYSLLGAPEPYIHESTEYFTVKIPLIYNAH